jgi:membrane protein implicated in regulation of membrane protease activity
MNVRLHKASFDPQCGSFNTKGKLMTEPTIWWLLAGAAVVVELLTGTFYLLMLAIGMAAAAVAAHLGASTVVQMAVAAATGGGAVVAWHFRQKSNRTEPPAQANPNVNLDIGETVQINAWNPDGTASVQYRGAHWTAIHRSGVSPTPGTHRVAEMVGSRLLVDKS